jgi:predicted dehydrogenase
VLLKLENGVNGVLMASQVAAGEENALKIRVYGENGGIEWQQQEPNTLKVKWRDQPMQVLRAGGNYRQLSRAMRYIIAILQGHLEGYLEAFANLCRNFALTLSTRIEGNTQHKRRWIFHR